MEQNEKSKVLLVLGAIGNVGIAVMLFICIRYFFTMDISENNSNSNNFLLFSDQTNQILSNILNADSFSEGLKPFIKILLIGLSGTLVEIVNYVFSEIPINFPKKEDLIQHNYSDFSEIIAMGIVHLLPGIILGIYLGIAVVFNSGELINKDNFSLIFRNYTLFMVLSQIVYIIALILVLFLILDAFISCGILGSIIRLPLMTVSNFSIMLAVCAFICFAVYVALIILGIIIIIAFLDAWSRPKVYIKY